MFKAYQVLGGGDQIINYIEPYGTWIQFCLKKEKIPQTPNQNKTQI